MKHPVGSQAEAVDLFGEIVLEESTMPTVRSRRSKYTPLSTFLEQQTECKCILSFGEIERIIGSKLPHGARARRVGWLWWGNDALHTQAKHGWLNVGWRLVDVQFAEERVYFTRFSD